MLLAVFAVLYGWFFGNILLFFERQSSQMGAMGMGPQSVNINQQLIRPVLMNVSVIMLFFLPLVTMRTYAEEKRSGTAAVTAGGSGSWVRCRPRTHPGPSIPECI